MSVQLTSSFVYVVPLVLITHGFHWNQKFLSNSTSKKGMLNGFDCKIAFAATHRTKQFLKIIVYKIACKVWCLARWFICACPEPAQMNCATLLQQNKSGLVFFYWTLLSRQFPGHTSSRCKRTTILTTTLAVPVELLLKCCNSIPYYFFSIDSAQSCRFLVVFLIFLTL